MSLPVATGVNRYLRHAAIERGLSANTLSAYERDLGEYSAFLARAGITEVGAITREHVTAFALDVRARRGLAASSTARMLSSVRGWHRFLLDEREVEADAAAEIRPPKAPARLPKALSRDQVDRLLAATDGDEPRQLRDKALLELLYATGARVSEAVDLDV